jgi:ribosomal protein L22
MAEPDSEKPKRRGKKAVSEVEAAADAAAPEEVQPTPADEAAADEAADVVLEAADEVDSDTDAEVGEAQEADDAAEAEEAVADEAVAESEEADDAEAAAEEAEKPKPRRRRTAKAKAEPAEPAEEASVEEVAEEPAVPAKPAPTRRRPSRDPSLPAPVVRAQARYVRSSARKARLVCDHIRGKSVEEARAILAHTPRAVARDWSKLLESAIANAENNHELVGEDLYVKAVKADEGPTIKRFRPRAMGRATRIRKRTSHLTILLTPKD